jgi:hypothetical protein
MRVGKVNTALLKGNAHRIESDYNGVIISGCYVFDVTNTEALAAFHDMDKEFVKFA